MKTLRVILAAVATLVCASFLGASVHESNTTQCTLKTVTVKTETWVYNPYSGWFLSYTSYADTTLSYGSQMNMDDVYGSDYRVLFSAVGVTQASDPNCVTETWQSFDEPQGWTYGTWSPACSTQPPCVWVSQSRTNQQVHLTGERSNLGNLRNAGSYTEYQNQSQTVAGCGTLTWSSFDEEVVGWHEIYASPCGSYWEDQQFPQYYDEERTTRTGERSQCGDERNVVQHTWLRWDSRPAQGCKPLNPRTFTQVGSWREVSSDPTCDHLSGQSFTQSYTLERTIRTGWTNDRGDEWNVSETTETDNRTRTASGTASSFSETVVSWHEVDSWPSAADYASGEAFTQNYREERTVRTGWHGCSSDFGVSESTETRQDTRTAYGTGQPPTITAHPVNSVMTIGQSGSFSVSATGSSLNYRWRKNGSNLGVTSRVLALEEVTRDSAGSYDVCVYNNFGGVTSQPATLTPNEPPVVLAAFRPSVVSPTEVHFSAAAQDFDSNLSYCEFLFFDLEGNMGWIPEGTGSLSGRQATGNFIWRLSQPLSARLHHVWARAYDGYGALDSNGGKMTTFPVGANTGASIVLSPLHIAPGDTITIAYKNAQPNSRIKITPWLDGSQVGSDIIIAADGDGNVPFQTSGFSNNSNYYARMYVNGSYVIQSNPVHTATEWGLTVVDGRGGGPSIQVGAAVPIEANPDPDGEGFVGWSIIEGPGTIANRWARKTTFIMGSGYAAVRANYSGIPQVTSPTSANGEVDQPFSYELTASNSPTTFTVSGLPSGLSYHLTNNPSLRVIIDGTPNVIGDFSIPVSASNDAGTGYGSITLHIAGASTDVAPAITSQPQGLTAGIGYPFGLTVQATGSPSPSFQWRKDGVNIPGATLSMVVRNSASESDSGVYSVVVSNRVGSVTSQSATVNVLPAAAPVITTHPLGGSVALGGSMSLSVTASGVPQVSYQWLRNNSAIVGATGPSLSLTNVTSADAGTYAVLVTNSVGGVISHPAFVRLNYAVGDNDHNGIADAWEQLYFNTVGVVPGQVLANGLTILQAYNLRVDPNKPYDPSSAGPNIKVKLSVIGRGGSGGNNVTLTINGVAYSFSYPSSAGNPWMISYNFPESIDVPFGASKTIQVTSTGDASSDFFIRADIDPETQPLLSSVVEFDGQFLGGISKKEIQGGQFTLVLRPKDTVPFAAFDDSTLRLQRQISLGLGRGRSGRSAGEILVSFGDWRSPNGIGIVVYRGEALEGAVETDPTHFQAKAPDGYVDMIRTHNQISVNFYSESESFVAGTYRDFSNATPIAAYTLDISDVAVNPDPAPSRQYDNVWVSDRSSYCTLTRTAGGISHQLEYESFSFVSEDNAQSIIQDHGPEGGGLFLQERWTWRYSTVTHTWPWRTVGATREGLTRLEFDNSETHERVSRQSPYTPGNIATYPGTSDFYTTRYLGSVETASVGFYEHHNTDGKDYRLVRAQALVRGIGTVDANGFGDPQEMPRRQEDSGDWSHPGITDLNGFGGRTHTEFFGHAMVINGPDNFGGTEPYLADGQPRQIRRSFLDNVLNSDSTDIVSTYSYVGNSGLIDGLPRPSQVVTKQGAVTIGQTSYGYVTGTLNGFNTLTTTETKSDGGSNPFVTIIRTYSQLLSGQPDLRGKPVAVTRPDRTKVSYAYFASGDDLVVSELNGKAGSSVNSYSGASIDPLDMEADKSTVRQRTFSRQGRPTRDATYLYRGTGGYQLLTQVDYSYDTLGHLLAKTDSSGRVLYSAHYTGFQKDDETDEQGITLSYIHDDYDRVRTITRASATDGTSTVPAVTTTYSYDPLGRPQTETVGATGSIVTSYTYDTAGRPKTTQRFSTATSGSGSPGPLTTTLRYSSPYPTVTAATLSDAGTKIEATFRDGAPKSTAGTAVPDVTYNYSYNPGTGDLPGYLVNTQSSTTGQVTTTYQDWAGRTRQVATSTYAGTTRVVSNSYSGSLLTRQETKVGSTSIAPARVFEYDDYGRLIREGLTTGSGTTVTGGTDYEVKEYEVGFVQDPSGVGSGWYSFQKVKVWPYDSSGAYVSNSRYASQTYTQVDGLDATTAVHVVALDFDGNKTETTATVDLAHANLITETTSTGTSATIEQVMLGGLLVSSTNAQGQTTIQGYDALGRLQTSTDPRTGTTYHAYHPGTTLVATVTPPDNRIVAYGYDSAGRLNYQSIDSKKAYFQYDPAGNLTHVWGDTVNPARYEYNDFAQRTKLHTYRSGTWTGSTLPSGFTGAGDVTTWTYQGATGLLLSKQDSVNPATTYTYTDLGQVQSRTDSRGWVTNYEYTDARKLLTKIDYTGAAALVTTDVIYHYDHAGRYDYVDDTAGRRTFSYYDTGTTQGTLDASARLKSERLTNVGNHTLTYRYQYGVADRANGASTGFDLNTSAFITYAYDSVLRVNSMTYGSGTAFEYAYVPNSNLIDTVTQGSGYQRDYDYRSDSNRLDQVKHFWGVNLTAESRLTYNTHGLRETEKTQGSAWMSALGRSSEAGVHADYTYTDRIEIESSGKYVLGADWSLGALRTDTAREYPYDSMGNRSSTAAPIWTANALNQVTAAAGFGTFSYDENGNLTSDGTRAYAYDGENRLISVTQGSSSWSYKYDYLGRRIEKSGTGVPTMRFLYDGWNPIAELDGANTVLRNFLWGLDVSGTLQGAGGVGGLLVIDQNGVQRLPVYDASHNVIGLCNASGAFVAAYEYDPFGNLQTTGGSYGASNPFRSATKYTDAETGLVYYGLRYYSPALGRFINRDPIEEVGGLNLYGFCGNDGINNFDLLGMEGDPFDNLYRTGDPRGSSGSDPFSTSLWTSGSSSGTSAVTAGRPISAETGQPIEGDWGQMWVTGYGATISSVYEPWGMQSTSGSNENRQEAPNSELRETDAIGGNAKLPTLNREQVAGVVNAWSGYIKFGGSTSEVEKLQMLFAQAVLFRRANGKSAMAMREATAAFREFGEGSTFTFKFGIQSERLGTTLYIERYGSSGKPISDAQMVVSIMHELVHGADRTHTWPTSWGTFDMRHQEIYRMQNQTLWDLGLPLDPGPRRQQVLDENGRPNGDAYIGPQF